MTFNDYQKKSAKYDLFNTSSDLASPAFLEKVLGLAGESGETCDKIKKILRDKKGIPTDEDKIEITKELGDVLWYLANISRYLDLSFDHVAENNLKKLEDRLFRHRLHGSGDNR